MTPPQTAELYRRGGHDTAMETAHPAASRSSRMTRHHATSARAGHGLGLRRTATALGTAALALSAAASVDLQERGPDLGRVRVDEGGWLNGPWSPRPQRPTHKERLVAQAIQRAPSCFDEGEDAVRGFWPDHQNFALYRTYGVTLATSNVTGSTLGCVHARATRMLQKELNKELLARQEAQNNEAWLVTGSLCFVMSVVALVAFSLAKEVPTTRALREPRGRRSGRNDRAPLLPVHDVEQTKAEPSYGTAA